MGSDALTTGSERLADEMVYRLESLGNVDIARHVIRNDPGVVALVETMERFRDGIYLRNEFQDHCIAALKTWETGK